MRATKIDQARIKPGAVAHQKCQCGNLILADSNFCRKCGRKRPPRSGSPTLGPQELNRQKLRQEANRIEQIRIEQVQADLLCAGGEDIVLLRTLSGHFSETTVQKMNARKVVPEGGCNGNPFGEQLPQKS